MQSDQNNIKLHTPEDGGGSGGAAAAAAAHTRAGVTGTRVTILTGVGGWSYWPV